MTPYEALGVAADADDATIKGAYRARAHKAHPDKGGDADEFHAVQRAYDLLSDPERRKRFDETGDVGAAPDKRGRLVNFVAQLITQVIDSTGDIDHSDIIKLAEDHIRKQVADAKAQQLQMDEKIRKYEKTLKKLKFKGQGENLVANLLRGTIGSIKRTIERIDEQTEEAMQLLEILAEYEYKFTKAPANGIQQGMSNFWCVNSQSQTTNT